MAQTKHLELSVIRTDGGTQMRAEIQTDVFQDYRDKWIAGVEFDPIDVFFDGAEYWIADGFHRFYGAREAQKSAIMARIHNGTVRDAILFACSANVSHGLRRSNEDKRRAVMALLEDDEWGQWSDNRIAEQAGVSQPFVGNIRRQLITVISSNGDGHEGDERESPKPERRKGKDGVTRTVPKKKLCERCARVGVTKDCVACAELKTKRKPKKTTKTSVKGDSDEGELEKFTDAEGVEVPADAVPAFQAAKDIEAICREIDDIKRRVEVISKGPGGRLIRFESFKQQLADAKGNLWANRPSHVCPYCKGTGKAKGKECEACKGECWVAKHIYAAAPGVTKHK